MKVLNLSILLILTVSAVVVLGCAPSEAELRDMVRDEIAKIDIPQGEAGPAGPMGATGLIGPQGSVGPAGERGGKGDQGEQGPDGAQGVPGVRGDTGPPGEAGIAGEIGAQGPRGAQGPQGPQGVAGEQGVAGIQGPAGERGEKGEAGAQGPKGEPGDARIPDVLEVEEIIVRIKDVDGGAISIRGGGDGRVATITWLHSVDGDSAGVIHAGGRSGMLLRNENPDGTWTRFCIDEDSFGICE